ncbi:uncharacterized protein LOC120340141 isoform X2 [Styela clava]
MSTEEMHRCKQRKQYKLMLLSLEDLMKILPSATDKDKPRTKQTLLSEANQYIHYLQLCIHQLGKETGYCDSKILEVLHWDSPCEKPCKCLDSLGLGSQQTVPTCMENRSDVPPEQDATVRRSGGLRRNCPWKFSPIRPLKRLKRNIENNLDKSSDDEQLSTPKNNSSAKIVRSWKTPRESEKKKKLGKNTESTKKITSPPGAVCDIITPPSSYKRTIIEDSPQSVSHNWADVSVRRSSSPWMPKPDTVYESIEDLAEEIVTQYEKQNGPGATEDELDDHFLSSSFALESFLDSTDDESLPLDNFQIKDLIQRQRPGVRDALLCQPSYPTSSTTISSTKASTVTSPNLTRQCRAQNVSNELSSPEHLLGFSPRLFLTGKRFDCS